MPAMISQPNDSQKPQSQSILSSLIREILSSPSNNQRINFSIPRHTTIVPVLHEYVYSQKYRNREIPIVFRDGSIPCGFPTGVLSMPEHPIPDHKLAIKIGLISFRHLDMDFLIDQYLLTNKQIGQNGSMASSEKQAFEAARELLTDAAFKDGGTVEMYHTGLEPPIVGFYRAVVQVIRDRIAEGLPRNLVISPRIYVSKLENKSPWTAESPGAQAHSYSITQSWM